MYVQNVQTGAGNGQTWTIPAVNNSMNIDAMVGKKILHKSKLIFYT